MIGGQGRLFGRAVTSCMAFPFSTWQGWQRAALILAKSLTTARCLPRWRNNKGATDVADPHGEEARTRRLEPWPHPSRRLLAQAPQDEGMEPTVTQQH